MEFILSCSSCIVRQIAQVTSLLNIEKAKSQNILRKVLAQLSNADYTKCTPELIGETWDLLESEIGFRDVYEKLKLQYDRSVLAQKDKILSIINAQADAEARFSKALFFAIYGNLIDLAAADSFDEKAFWNNAKKTSHIPFSIDEREKLFDQLKNAKSLLYIGDNSGEIALDKIFIQVIKELFAGISCTYTVRGHAVLNDVTMLDAEAVDMAEVADVIPNGSKAAGTVLSTVSAEFLELYNSADVIIAKGQGNFESLYPSDKPNLFYLLMAKCPAIASIFGVEPMTLICKRAKKPAKEL